MTARTAPQHGERRCYLRGCRRTECLNAHYRYMSRYRLDRQQGAGTRRIPAEPAAQHVQTLYEAGWTTGQIAVAAECADRTVADLLHRKNKTIRKDLAARILNARPTLAALPGATKVDATGTIRRAQALMAIGHSLTSIANAMGVSHYTVLGNILNGLRPTVTVATARSAASVYRKLAEVPGTAQRARNVAAERGWPPPAAWDDERIDDPTATPDWTGHCGTDRGWWMHTNQHLPMCEPCATAHEEWKAEHRALPGSGYSAALGRARAAASSRGVDIAHDGRELMRLGCDYEQAAARLGITRQHLQQELQRHPEKAAA
ncbi:hypothetical protein [Streptomyces sp900116325]|uniref:hypothetical protein n=1 Tax=Streptomyces sp. 900116325 TaxID=3154295 RepID=UPI003330BB0E